MIALGAALLCAPGLADTLHVDSRQTNQPPDGLTWPTAFTSMGAGLSVARPGDEVWVALGRYLPFGAGWWDASSAASIAIPTGVSVYGGFAGLETHRHQRNPTANPTIISGWGTGYNGNLFSPRLPLVSFPPNADNRTRLDGFRLEFNQANFGAAIYVGGGSPIIANNTIVSNRVDGPLGGSAIFVERTATRQPLAPLEMFSRVAGRLFATDQRMGSDGRLITHSNIMVWPTNDYDAAVHRVLQVAVNMVDATTNRGEAFPYFPTVIRPYLRREISAGRTNIYVAGYQLQGEIEPAGIDAEFFVRKSNYRDLDASGAREQIPESPEPGAVQPLTLGLPLVVGTKKGLPNFNELAVETSIYLERRLQLRRPTVNSLPNQTNEFYVLGITNVFGLEGWNSYQAAYPRPLTLAVEVDFDMAVLGENLIGTSPIQQWPPIVGAGSRPVSTNFTASMVIPASAWTGRMFQVPLMTNYLFLSNSLWRPTQHPRYTPAPSNSFSIVPSTPNQFYIPDWILSITNRLRYVVMDGGHIIDYVNIGGMIWQTNLIESMTRSDQAGRDSQGSQFWDMRRLGGGSTVNEPTQGTWNQLLVSMGFINISSVVWRNYSARNYTSQDRVLAIDAFRRFALAGPPLNYPRGSYSPIDPTGLIAEAPFTPARRLELKRVFEVTDPLVHFTRNDVAPPPGADAPQVLPGGVGASTDLRLRGMGRLNKRYSPWLSADDYYTSNEAFRDPMVTSPDDWQFASGLALNHHWFDRIHRGTPWQTIYYGGGQASRSVFWNDYSHPLMLPQNDWRWIEEFRKDWLGLTVVEDTAPEPIIVNNTIANNTAGNSATGSAIHFEPGTAAQVVNNIVAFNTAGLEQLAAGSPFLLANCIFGNPNGDYLGLAAGLRDFPVDPQLRDPARGDFTLSTSSSLIDAAHPLPWLAGWLTVDEPARWQNSHFDLGAAELPINVVPWLSIDLESGSTAPTLTLFGFPGLRYRLEMSEDLAIWSPLADVFTPGGLVEVSFEPASERIFFRARKSTN